MFNPLKTALHVLHSGFTVLGIIPSQPLKSEGELICSPTASVYVI